LGGACREQHRNPRREPANPLTLAVRRNLPVMIRLRDQRQSETNTLFKPLNSLGTQWHCAVFSLLAQIVDELGNCRTQWAIGGYLMGLSCLSGAAVSPA